ncbi:Transducin/WD40 repeat-like superfamily protein, putative isoform 3 [Hibiscus syriacus]|uniref:Transducin/WD40 repeat-like superfamily protein, putative isoform 3 n=1 Tax=Hibiscus syriacus TaxID=106335 RepID=A0A6A2XGS5_HIBSY|nr:WD repeat-containing protein 44-like [Hibiscus syriacus]KAE8674688.1 Transducin/WD40 repeat-like superfamily protein, putative isoform 3 [Hibiscus syriacus]
MGSYLEEEDQFFDIREEISSASEKCGSSPDIGLVDDFVDTFDQYKFWSMFPESIDKRRHNFGKWMSLSFNGNSNTGENHDGSSRAELELGISRISEDSGAVLRTSGLEEGVSSNKPSFLFNDAQEPAENCSKDDHLAHPAKNLDGLIELTMAEQSQNGIISRSQSTDYSDSVSSELYDRTTMPSPSVDPHLDGEAEGRPLIDMKRIVKKSWLRKLGAMIVPSKPGNHEWAYEEKMKGVRPHPSNKHSKELSSLYCGQEFVAHEGSILTMKFSLDGEFLATAGEDCIVRVWKIVEDDSLDKFDIQDLDPSCLYYRMNHLSQLIPLNVDKERIDKITRLRRSSDSTCVIFPPKVFRVLEKPVHEFQGHSAEILALSWSNNGLLLSSSVDKTVRLWQVGCDSCLRVFYHNNYVTSVAFNPVDDNYFISGSIDGKVRFWEVLRCRVIDYTDVSDIVTAVCYRPDGKGGIVGSMTGNCRFYNIIGTRLQLDEPIYLQGKKKLPGKRVTGFEFSPTDPNKVLITSADSLVRVLSGRDVVCKVKASGFRVAMSQISATFSQDGKQIISASEDSNIYIWNYANQEKSCSKAKSISSCESFLSHNASVAIPWRGIKTIPAMFTSLELGGDGGRNRSSKVEREQTMPHSSPDCFSLPRVLLDSLTKGSPTWPEETLPNASAGTVASDVCRFELKVLKSAYQSMLSSHKWGLVIVTAGWDGRIRTYLNYGLPIRL